jgi:hypothetical protein
MWGDQNSSCTFGLTAWSANGVLIIPFSNITEQTAEQHQGSKTYAQRASPLINP